METVYDRVKSLCNKHGLSINALEKTVGLAPSSIKKWDGTSLPSTQSLLKVANYFHVSLDYLVGRTEVEEGAEDLLSDDDWISLHRAMLSVPKNKRKPMAELIKTVFAEDFE